MTYRYARIGGAYVAMDRSLVEVSWRLLTCQPLHAEIRRARPGGTLARLVLSHGDLWPGNVLTERGDVYAIDGGASDHRSALPEGLSDSALRWIFYLEFLASCLQECGGNVGEAVRVHRTRRMTTLIRVFDAYERLVPA